MPERVKCYPTQAKSVTEVTGVLVRSGQARKCANVLHYIALFRNSCINPALGARQPWTPSPMNRTTVTNPQSQVQKVFAQHSTFGIKLEVDKKFLNYAYKSAEIVASGSAESGDATLESEMRAAKTAAAVKEQAKARRAAEAKAKAKAMAKAKAKAKAKASEKEERRLLAEAARAAKATEAEAKAEAEAEAKRSKGVKQGAELARPLVQVRPLVQTHVLKSKVPQRLDSAAPLPFCF